MVINSSDKSPFEIRDSTGKEFKEIYDNQGRLLFKNWNEIQGSPPITFRGYGKNLTECRIYGNTVRNGTPSPEAPVDVVGCGNLTDNLIPNISTANGWVLGYLSSNGKYTPPLIYNEWLYNGYIPVKPGWDVTVSASYDGANKSLSVYGWDGNKTFIPSAKLDIRDNYTNAAYHVPNGIAYISIAIRTFCQSDEQIVDTGWWVMLNLGSTPLPYEPYGYKIPVTVSNDANSVTTPVYIGSEPLHKIGDYADYVDFKRGVVVRRIKKLVLTGEEAWNGYGYAASGVGAALLLADILSNGRMNGFCTHFTPLFTPAGSAINGITFGASNNVIYITFSAKTTKALNLTNTASVKTWLAAQYEAGTPVTIWYVLAEPEEEPLENLLPIQTIKGTNILTADTTVQPSEMYLKGKIKPAT